MVLSSLYSPRSHPPRDGDMSRSAWPRLCRGTRRWRRRRRRSRLDARLAGWCSGSVVGRGAENHVGVARLQSIPDLECCHTSQTVFVKIFDTGHWTQ